MLFGPNKKNYESEIFLVFFIWPIKFASNSIMWDLSQVIRHIPQKQ